MSTNYLNRPEISREMIEASMKRARIAAFKRTVGPPGSALLAP